MKNKNVAERKNESVAERAAALLYELLDVIQRIEDAPHSPVDTFVRGKQRRLMRRGAEKLRRGEARPKYRNLFTTDQLADIYQQTAERDEIREQTSADCQRIWREIGRLIAEDGPAVQKTWEAIRLETFRLAKENGPDSEAAQRLHQLEVMDWAMRRCDTDRRRGKPSGPNGSARPYAPARPDNPEDHPRLTAAQELDSPPPGATVIAIPPEGMDSGRRRIFLRIGIREAEWIGSFERGHNNVSTVSMMPDHKHFFISAGGAGYIIDVKSRTLVEKCGTEIVGVTANDRGTLFFVNHNDRIFEAFGPAGRLWKTDPIGLGGFREMAITDDHLVGKARRVSLTGAAWVWVGFAVNLATGEVRFDDARTFS